MKITDVTVQAFFIEGAKALDPVTVISQDYDPGQGRIIIVCFGRAWSAYWGAMAGRGVLNFVADCETDYVVGNLVTGQCPEAHDLAYLCRIVDAVRAAIKERLQVPA